MEDKEVLDSSEYRGEDKPVRTREHVIAGIIALIPLMNSNVHGTLSSPAADKKLAELIAEL